MSDEYREEYAAIATLRAALRDLSEAISAERCSFEQLDEHLRWILFVGDIHVFALSNARAFHFVSSATARQLGYASVDEVHRAGSFTIMNRHYKKLECVYWVRHLLRLPHNAHVEVMDYFARTKVLQRSGKLGFEPRRYLACNLKDYRGRHDIICASFETSNLLREACTFRVATHPDADIRAATPQVWRLATSARRMEIFVRRSRKQSPDRIARELGISVATVNEHLTRIYEILGFEEQKLERLITFAKRSGLKAVPLGASEDPVAMGF